MSTVQLPFTAEDALDGLLNYLGTKGGVEAYINPVTGRNLTILANISRSGARPHRLADRDSNAFFQSRGGSSSWSPPGDSVTVDLGPYRSMLVDHFAMCSRPDSNTHHPVNWSLLGSNDCVSWEPLHVNTTASFTQTRQWQSWTVSANEYFRYLRIQTTGPNSNGQNQLIFSSMEFWGSLAYAAGASEKLLPDFGEPGLFLGQPVNSVGELNSSYKASNAVDGDLDTSWHSSSAAQPWLSVDIGAPAKVYRFDVRNRHDSDSAGPTAFTIAGSNDENTWTALYTTPTVPDYTNSDEEFQKLVGFWRTFYVNSPSAFRYYRIQANAGSNLAISEFEAYEAPSIWLGSMSPMVMG